MVSSAGPHLDASRDSTGAYQLAQPTVADAHTALRQLYGPHSADIWHTLLARAGLTGQETDFVSFERLVSFMHGAEPVIRLCGRSLAIRAAAYRSLAAAHQERR